MSPRTDLDQPARVISVHRMFLARYWPRFSILRNSSWGLAIVICGFVLFFARYVTLEHAAFETFGYDLGNFSQAVWNTIHGRLMGMTTVSGSTFRWAFHFDPILLLFVPIYALFPAPTTLTLLQVLIVAIGALPIFWIARDLLHSEWAGIGYAGVYLMLPALQAAVVFDFHGVTVAMTFLAFALWALLQRRYKAFAVSALLVMSCKEDMPLLIFMMGLYILFVQREWKVGAITVLGSATWFAITNFVIIPFYSPTQDNIHIVRYGALGSNLTEVMLSFFVRPIQVLAVAFHPQKLPYWVRLTMPVAFTSFFAPLLLLLSAPSLAINTLSANPLVYRPDAFHYTAPVVPFIVVSSISGVAHLSGWLGGDDQDRAARWRLRLIIVVIGASLGYHVMVGYTPLRLGFEWPSPDEHDTLATQMLGKIPHQASVSAQNSLASHLANRQYLYIFPKVENAQYIALDMTLWSDFYPIKSRAEFCREVRQFVEASNYGTIYLSNGLLLLQRDVPGTITVSPDSICDEPYH